MNTKAPNSDMEKDCLRCLDNFAMILRELLDCASLDESTEARDCLEVFDQYEWTMKPGVDDSNFQALKAKGSSGQMTKEELDQFMDMISREGDFHVYFTIRQGYRAIEEYNRRLAG